MNQFVSKMLVNSKAYASHTILYKKEEEKNLQDRTNEFQMADKNFQFSPSKDFLFKTEGYFHFDRDLDSI